ncbi:RagB/SusD family nutrient uptake outer membrane protein [Sanguibacteroides justesenii]|uniref:RagB/SusD family nutrient uptake outer membrane protein n=1 Tax=Sanguibacteroides justesenii TaxID=1547597 RepID=UPI000D8FCC81|nr:RagB/SusD family nutrient uptake outer membrane protein [Sanguibacteroides justesenii]PXZ44224.1 RagB/SusD family nutrient uptake outer membrane protein [Sanguibacteroides justesenii]
MKKYRFLLLLFLPFFISGCNEWLNVKPEDEIDEEDLFDSADGFRHALNGIYYTMGTGNLYGMNMSWGIVDALGQVYDYTYGSSELNAMERGAAVYDWDYEHLKPKIESIWNETYNIVANCNNLIKNIENTDPDMFPLKNREKSMIWGEALALRAFLQFDMLRLFAPAPVTQPGGRKFIPYINMYPSYVSNKKTVDECLTLITEDLKEAKKLLWQIDTAKSFSPSVTFEMSGTGDNIFFYRRGYHMNYWAATALLARVYLYAQKETEALEQANEIITFVAKNHAFPFNTSSGGSKLYTDVMFGLYVIDLPELNQKINDITNEDNATFLCVSEIENNYFEKDLTFNNNLETFISNDYRYTYWIHDWENYNSYYRLKKYDAPTTGGSTQIEISKTLVPLIRMSEIYYMAAEILAKKDADGLAKAKTYLNYVKEGRGLKKTDQSIIDVTNATMETFNRLLINDMRRDWIGEGQTFYLYKRLNKNIPAESGKTIMASEEHFVVPLPDSETNIN